MHNLLLFLAFLLVIFMFWVVILTLPILGFAIVNLVRACKFKEEDYAHEDYSDLYEDNRILMVISFGGVISSMFVGIFSLLFNSVLTLFVLMAYALATGACAFAHHKLAEIRTAHIANMNTASKSFAKPLHATRKLSEDKAVVEESEPSGELFVTSEPTGHLDKSIQIRDKEKEELVARLVKESEKEPVKFEKVEPNRDFVEEQDTEYVAYDETDEVDTKEESAESVKDEDVDTVEPVEEKIDSSTTLVVEVEEETPEAKEVSEIQEIKDEEEDTPEAEDVQVVTTVENKN